ncbi:MAG: aminoacyl-histidine dipeptidase [Acidobacteria bacterium]|nr:MAG: aminoacyl-histidine dipeptidase [Acidobacteriota bacterium]
MPDNPFDGLEPAILWKHFEVFTRTPRPSGREEQIAAYVLDWAAQHGYETARDEVGNLVVRVPASPGREDAPPVIIQGHLDMVCERNADSPYDSETGPVHVVRDGDWLTAEGTTLGADNAIGVTAGMACAEDPSVAHGPLELLMTIDEETGMTGAMGLDPSLVRGRTMLNLDSEEDGVLFVGCAGGCDTRIELPLHREPLPGGVVLREIAVTGLLGGHSGLDIIRNRANAIHVLARALEPVAALAPLRIVGLAGGSKRNAIPREAFATIAVPAAEDARLRAAVDAVAAAVRTEYAGIEPQPSIAVREPAQDGAEALDETTGLRLVRLLRALPSGVIAMSRDIEGLVETSTNLGVVRAEPGDDTATIVCCSRSSVSEALDSVLEQIAAIAALAGASAERTGRYPGWKPNLDSPVLKVTRGAFERLFGREPHVTAIHAGLECGLIGERIPGMDMVSFGPEIRGAHSPDERVQISSVGRFWQLLTAVLDDLSRA